jgi:hypothetical protein
MDGADKAASKIGKVSPRLMDQVAKVFAAETQVLASYIRKRHLAGGTTETRLRVRTGRLRASTVPIPIRRTPTSITGGVQFGTVYARTHVGPKGQITTIRPVRAKWLTIPLEAAMTKAGVARGAARSGMWGETFVARSRKGNLILFGKRVIQKGSRSGETTGKIQPLFLLKKEVKIKARVHPEDIFAYFRPRLVQQLMRAGIKVVGE